MSARLRSSTRASTAASDFLADQGGDTKTKQDSKPRARVAQQPKGAELKRLKYFALFTMIASLTFIGAVLYFSLNDTLRLYPKSITAEALKGFNSRFEYCMRYQTLQLAWLIFMVNATIFSRFANKALNPLVPSTEVAVQAQKNIMTNSIEQTFISVLLQFAFASFAEPALVMKIIPAVNILAFIGRIAFFIGYPLKRTFGMNLTLTPNLLLAIFNLYKFGSFLNLY